MNNLLEKDTTGRKATIKSPLNNELDNNNKKRGSELLYYFVTWALDLLIRHGVFDDFGR